jgi:hypothetical protein
MVMILKVEEDKKRLEKDYRYASDRMLIVMGLVKSYCKKLGLSSEDNAFCVNEAKKKLRAGASAGFSIFFGQNWAKKIAQEKKQNAEIR